MDSMHTHTQTEIQMITQGHADKKENRNRQIFHPRDYFWFFSSKLVGRSELARMETCSFSVRIFLERGTRRRRSDYLIVRWEKKTTKIQDRKRENMCVCIRWIKGENKQANEKKQKNTKKGGSCRWLRLIEHTSRERGEEQSETRSRCGCA